MSDTFDRGSVAVARADDGSTLTHNANSLNKCSLHAEKTTWHFTLLVALIRDYTCDYSISLAKERTKACLIGSMDVFFPGEPQ